MNDIAEYIDEVTADGYTQQRAQAVIDRMGNRYLLRTLDAVRSCIADDKKIEETTFNRSMWEEMYGLLHDEADRRMLLEKGHDVLCPFDCGCWKG